MARRRPYEDRRPGDRDIRGNLIPKAKSAGQPEWLSILAGFAGSGSQAARRSQAHAGSGPQRGRHAAGSGPRQQSASAHLMPESKRKIAERLRFHQESAAAEAGKLWDEGSRRNLGFGKATGDFPT